jgi:hypothetical protein
VGVGDGDEVTAVVDPVPLRLAISFSEQSTGPFQAEANWRSILREAAEVGMAPLMLARSSVHRGAADVLLRRGANRRAPLITNDAARGDSSPSNWRGPAFARILHT